MDELTEIMLYELFYIMIPRGYVHSAIIKGVALAYLKDLMNCSDSSLINGDNFENWATSITGSGIQTNYDILHWNMRYFPDEILTPSQIPRFRKRVSNLSLGLLSESTWYEVDWSKSEPLILSKVWCPQYGCDLVRTKCGDLLTRLRTDLGDRYTAMNMHWLGALCDPIGRVQTGSYLGLYIVL